jgi:hypothetical protein
MLPLLSSYSPKTGIMSLWPTRCKENSERLIVTFRKGTQVTYASLQLIIVKNYGKGKQTSTARKKRSM